MLRLWAFILVGFGLFVLSGTNSAFAKLEPIDRDQSKLEIRVEGLDNNRLRYYYAGWNENYTKESYIVFYRSKQTGQYLFARLVILVNDENYWGSASKVTTETIKRIKVFSDKDITITYLTAGMNAQTDSAVGEPGYLLFTADDQHCVYARRFSDFGRHGGTVVPSYVMAIYCAPNGEPVTRAQGAALAKSGLIYKGEE